MARKNRVTVPDGIYHITSRICNKAMLFKPDEIKEKIVKWMYDIADFSGVEVYAWCIMDNHIHLLVHVPRVPERLWTDPSREPAAWAFGMRPPECFPPLWFEGDSPRNPLISHGDCPRWPVLPRPELGFMLDDEEMVARLARLYSPKAAEGIAERWKVMRSRNHNAEVDEEKRRYCHRMYNISQFVKTLKERIASRYNAEFEHEGCLWQGRFYSGVVENCREVLSVVAGYIEYNPVKAKISTSPECWRFNSWSTALGRGVGSDRCRAMYEKMLGCDWASAKIVMRTVLNDKLPDGVSPEEIKEYYDKYDEEADPDRNDELGQENASQDLPPVKYRASQAIRCGMWFFKKGGYIGRTMEFARASVAHLHLGFPRAGFKSIKRCRAFVWDFPVVPIVPRHKGYPLAA